LDGYPSAPAEYPAASVLRKLRFVIITIARARHCITGLRFLFASPLARSAQSVHPGEKTTHDPFLASIYTPILLRFQNPFDELISGLPLWRGKTDHHILFRRFMQAHSALDNSRWVPQSMWRYRTGAACSFRGSRQCPEQSLI